MSTDYGLKCELCNTKLILDGLRDWAARRIITQRSALLTLHRAAQETEVEATAFYVPGGFYGFSEIGEFLEAHVGHDLVVVDEHQS